MAEVGPTHGGTPFHGVKADLTRPLPFTAEAMKVPKPPTQIKLTLPSVTENHNFAQVPLAGVVGIDRTAADIGLAVTHEIGHFWPQAI